MGRTSGGNGPFLERKLRHRDAGSPVSDLLRMDRDLGFHARLPGIVFGESAHRSPQVWGLEEHLVHPDASATPPHTHTHTHGRTTPGALLIPQPHTMIGFQGPVHLLYVPPQDVPVALFYG